MIPGMTPAVHPPFAGRPDATGDRRLRTLSLSPPQPNFPEM